MDAMDLNTSAGFPWNTKKLSSKKDLIHRNDEGTITWMHPELISAYNTEHDLRKNKTVRPAVVFSDFLKDERLKPGKDTRLINGAPITYVILIRQYFLHFFAAFQSNNFKNNIGVGMNVHGMDTTHLMMYLRSKGDKYICGDYSNFGPTLDPDMVVDFVYMVNAWYDRYCPTNTPESGGR